MSERERDLSIKFFELFLSDNPSLPRRRRRHNDVVGDAGGGGGCGGGGGGARLPKDWFSVTSDDGKRELMVISFSYSLHAYREGPLWGCEPVRLTVGPRGVTGGMARPDGPALSSSNENCVKSRRWFFVNCSFSEKTLVLVGSMLQKLFLKMRRLDVRFVNAF